MPRRSAGAVRATLRCRARPDRRVRIPGLSPAMLDHIARLESSPGEVARWLGQWRASARAGAPGTDHSDCCEMPYCRTELAEILRVLPGFVAARLRGTIAAIDREYLARTLPYPLARPESAWWYRRCPHIDRVADVPRMRSNRAMTNPMPNETTNLDRYGNGPLEWSRAHDALAAVPTPEITYFLGTSRPDGTPHAAGIGAQWLTGDLYFTSSPAARKARDIAVNPRCTISARLPGIDVVLDGIAARVRDGETLERVAAGYRASGWPAHVEADALTAPFNAPSAGPPPWHVYRFAFHTVVGVATTEPYGATRWRFER